MLASTGAGTRVELVLDVLPRFVVCEFAEFAETACATGCDVGLLPGFTVVVGDSSERLAVTVEADVFHRLDGSIQSISRKPIVAATDEIAAICHVCRFCSRGAGLRGGGEFRD